MSKSLPLYKVKGFPELLKKIKQLSDDKAQKEEILRVLKKVAKATVSAAKKNAPIRKGGAFSSIKTRKTIIPGTLKKSIGTIEGKKGAAKTNPTLYVGPRVKGQYNGYYGAWVEEGHNIYNKGFKRNRQGDSKANNAAAKKRTSGKFYMKKTFEQTEGKVTKESEVKIAKYIQKRISKLSNGG